MRMTRFDGIGWCSSGSFVIFCLLLLEIVVATVIIGERHQENLVLENHQLNVSGIPPAVDGNIYVGIGKLATVLSTGEFVIISGTSIELDAAVSNVETTHSFILRAQGTINITAAVEVTSVLMLFDPKPSSLLERLTLLSWLRSWVALSRSLPPRGLM